MRLFLTFLFVWFWSKESKDFGNFFHLGDLTMLGNNKKILGNNEIFGVLDVGLLFRFSGRDRHQTSVVQLLVLLFFFKSCLLF